MTLILLLSCLSICSSFAITPSTTNSTNESQQHSTTTTQSNHIESFDIEYPLTNLSFTDYNDCSLSLQLNLININTLYNILSSNTNLQNSILYWLHSHLFLLIDTSFVHNIDTYTNDFWNEYYLHLLTITNQTQNTITLSINICIDQIEIQSIIQTELTTDGTEIAAFVRHKLTDYININYKNIITDNLFINIITGSNSYITTIDAISSISSINNNKQQIGYIFTEKMIYIAIIGVCMIIMALIVMVYIILCIKNRTSLKLEQAIKDIKSQNNKKNNSINFNTQPSIDPIHINIPKHVLSIDSTALNCENNSNNNSIVIERNKLALVPEPNKMDNVELEELKVNINDILMENKCNNYKSNIQSLSARNMNQKNNKNNINEMNIIYNRTNSKSVIISKNNIQHKNENKNDSENNNVFHIKERKSLTNSPQIRKYRNYPQRHSVIIHNSMGRKQYAKRKIMENKRSQSKPNLHLKKYKNKNRKLNLKPSHSNITISNNNNIKFPLQYNSNSMHNILCNNNRRKRNNNKSVQSLNLHFDINNIPQPNSKSINDDIGKLLHLNDDWESEPSKSSTNGIIVGTPTTKGAGSQLEQEGNSNDDMSNSDAQSDIINDDTQSISTMDNNNENINKNKNINVYKIVELNKERITLTQKIPPSSKNISIPPPPPKNPIIKVNGNDIMYENSITNDEYEESNINDSDFKFDGLSMVAIHSNHSKCQPSF